LKEILWETTFPSFNHNSAEPGCLVDLSDTSIRRGVYSMELESEKLFFNIFDEINMARISPDYANNKIKKFSKSIQLVVDSIKTMTTLN
jgi:hypothetical protein